MYDYGKVTYSPALMQKHHKIYVRGFPLNSTLVTWNHSSGVASAINFLYGLLEIS